jgi:hypothetical protein
VSPLAEALGADHDTTANSRRVDTPLPGSPPSRSAAPGRIAAAFGVVGVLTIAAVMARRDREPAARDAERIATSPPVAATVDVPAPSPSAGPDAAAVASSSASGVPSPHVASPRPRPAASAPAQAPKNPLNIDFR